MKTVLLLGVGGGGRGRGLDCDAPFPSNRMGKVAMLGLKASLISR